jgi:CheY-like chemotaxis protein
MDLHMPGLDGFSAIRALRAAEPADGPRPVIVALTADATPAAAARASEAGADATMIKPIDRARLAELLAASTISTTSSRLSA